MIRKEKRDNDAKRLFPVNTNGPKVVMRSDHDGIFDAISFQGKVGASIFGFIEKNRNIRK